MAANSNENVPDWKLPREFFGLVFLFWSAFTFLSLASYDYLDPSFNQAAGAGHAVRNMTGLVGAYWAGLLVEFFGLCSFFLSFWMFWFGLRCFFRRLAQPAARWAGLSLLVFVLLSICGTMWATEHLSIGQVFGGGFFGRLFSGLLQRYFSSFGAGFLLFFLFLIALQLISGLSWKVILEKTAALTETILFDLREKAAAWLENRRERRLERQTAAQNQEETVSPEPASRVENKTGAAGPSAIDRFFSLFGREKDKGEAEARNGEEGEFTFEPDPAGNAYGEPYASVESSEYGETGAQSAGAPQPVREKAAPRSASRKAQEKPAGQPARREQKGNSLFGKKKSAGDGEMPSLDLLSPVPAEAKAALDAEIPKRQAQSLVNCLADFGIQGEVQAVVPGPVVTMFEYKPAPGVKISRIAGLSDDLALTMKAMAVRIEAPIPGKDSVGIEIPSEKRQTVYLREILESKEFQQSSSKLTLAIGKDIQGKPHVADLAKMPHLLVAGATGAGKSVCINGLLLSILYKARPDEVKLLLVDPKRIELSVYNDLPHLVHPVVTEMAMAKSALDWAVHDMDKRYEAMARLGVRNITSFNEKIAKMGDDKPEELADLEPMPYLVIIIDELADLMMTAAKDVEVSIVRLAQLARAAGIHLVLATQRPSVDVVTGLIKANFPTRISFQVTSKHDSRTILDTVGAEHLLGRGDMLFKPSGGRLTRRHGAFVSDEETAAVVGYWKERAEPGYAVDFAQWQQDAGAGNGDGGDMGDGGDGYDPMYDQALEFVMEQGKASISLIQRRFRIGFNRAARIIEQMERDGLLGPQDGSKPRTVLRRDQ